MRWVGRILIAVFASIGLLTVLTVGALLWQLDRLFEPAAVELPDRTVLQLDLRQPLADGPPQGPIVAPFDAGELTVRQVVEAIDRARLDDRVAALRADFGADVFTLAMAQEVRDAVLRFRESGKPALAYADSYGDFGNGTASYYLASAFDEVWLRPAGSVGVTGIYLEVPFANELLTDIGVEPEFVREGQYKTFPETFTEDGLAGPHEEMLESLAGSLFAQVVDGIAEARGLEPEAVESLIDRAPLLAPEAQEAGLVDQLAPEEALVLDLEERIGDGFEGVGVRPYLQGTQPADGETEIALIYGVGTIVLEDGGDVPVLGGQLMGAYNIARAFDDAIEDDAIAAIVLRIDSGGGSAIASTVIGDAVRRAREVGKPVIVSMSTAAASGGYWIAAPATEIVAQPATLTGSIGVFAGSFDSRALWDDIGVNWDSVQRGENADLWSAVDGFSEEGRQRIDAFVDSIYAQFIAVVAEGRGLEPDAVREVAQGRVWTGAQAAEIGLVDRLGGLDAAYEAVRQALDLPADTPLSVRILPEPPSPWEAVQQLIGAPSAEAAMAAALDRVPALERLAPLLRTPGDRLLQMPPLIVRP